MYTEVSVVVNGVLEEDETFTDYTLMRNYLFQIEDEATSHGYPVEVFIIEHDHALDVKECACVQYLQDHHPSYVFNKEEV